MSRFQYAALRELHLEVTSHCNLSCPMCARNVFGGARSPNLEPEHMSLARFSAIVPGGLLEQLETLLLCGNYGDPAVAPDTLPILESARRHNSGLQLIVHSHGSARSPRWWRALAGLGVRCVFGIDGLEDTNAVYRRGARWSQIIDNVRAFVDAGGRARWQYLVFGHNQHQVEAARALAAELGVERFKVKHTHRFYKSSFVPRGPDGRPDPTRAPRYPILDDEGREIGALEPATAETVEGSAFAEALGKSGGSGFRKLREAAPVDCKVLDPASVYVSADGLVFPCCWLGNIRAATVRPNHPVLTLAARTVGGEGGLRAPAKSLQEIVEGPFFEAVAASWGYPSVAEGRLATCANICGGGQGLRAQSTVGP